MDILKLPACQAAPLLLGSVLERTINDQVIRLRIVETEAYDQTDAASHSFNGQTERTKIMFGPSGYLYVYFTYGMHYCCNIVVGETGHGSAVLIRAVELLGGNDSILRDNRSGKQGIELTNGPAKLCQALGITKQHNGHDLRQPPIRLIINKPLLKHEIITTTRIGISKAVDEQWRFYIKSNPYVSKP